MFTTTQGAVPPEALAEVILGMDPPRHTKHRNVVQAVFTPKMIRQKEESIRFNVTALIDDVIETGDCDFVDDIAVELPLRIIADMLGVPLYPPTAFRMDEHAFSGGATADPQLGMGALMEIGGYMSALTAERKANPTDDLVSRFIVAEVDGESLSEAEVTFFSAS